MWTSAVTVVAVLISLHCADSAFIVHPVSVNTSLNSTVEFTCEAEAVVLLFYVNNTFAGNAAIGNKGFTEGLQVMVNATVISRTLTAEAREGNDNTNISCRTSPGNTGIESDIALLRIQGPLASVGNLRATILNGGSSVQLNWTEPYTLDSVPISGYSINGQLVNTTEAILYSNNTDPCTLTTAVVTAINGAGEGEPASISFYYQTVPRVNPPVSIIPSVMDGQVSLQVNVNVNQLCPGEYPTDITVDILNTDDAIELTTSLQPVVAANGQLMMDNTPIAVPDNLIAFIVNVSLSNEGGVFTTIPSFPFGFLGPVLNIDSSIDSCSTISITWNRPAVDEMVPILHYTLRIYDAVNGALVTNVSSIEGTSYQFEDQELFRHRYTYVIAAVNELGEGETANGTFSYQREPGLPVVSAMISVTNGDAFVQFTIPITSQCTGDAPESVTVTVQCGTTVVYSEISPVEYTPDPVSITGTAQLPTGSQCNLSITFSNTAGESNLTIPLDTVPITTIVVMSSSTVTSVTPSIILAPRSSNDNIPAIAGGAGGAAVIIVVTPTSIVVVVIVYSKKKQKRLERNRLLLTTSEPMTTDGGKGAVLRPVHTDDGSSELIDIDSSSATAATIAVVVAVNTVHSAAPPKSGLPVYEELQKFSDKRPRAPPQSMERVEYQDIDHIRVKQPAAHSNPAAIQGSVTMVTAQHIARGEEVPPPVPVKTGRGQPTQQSAATRGGNISPSDIQLATVSSSSIPGHVVQEENHDAAAAAGRDPHLPKDSQLATYL